MKNPIRRNRNIGTAKQGHGQNNKLVIPYPAVTMQTFYERLGEYKTVERIINKHKFKFVVEKTRKSSFHSCTVDDIERVIEHIPRKDYGSLNLIVLRQPKRKEEILSPVWGRLVYSYEFENDYCPAIIIESFDIEQKLKWNKKQSIESQKELERLKKDGHEIITGKKLHEAEYKLNNIRATQLYRTLPHEFGHYVHYMEVVLNPLKEMKTELDKLDNQIDDYDTKDTNPLYTKWSEQDDIYYVKFEQNREKYFSIISREKEVYAHKYAGKLKKHLTDKNIIPFERILNKRKIELEKLDIKDFK